MAVATQHDWPRTSVHVHATALSLPPDITDMLAKSFVRDRIPQQVMGVRAVCQPIRSKQIPAINLLRPATTVTTRLLCGSMESFISAV
jgi:hypothetical protein